MEQNLSFQGTRSYIGSSWILFRNKDLSTSPLESLCLRSLPVVEYSLTLFCVLSQVVITRNEGTWSHPTTFQVTGSPKVEEKEEIEPNFDVSPLEWVLQVLLNLTFTLSICVIETNVVYAKLMCYRRKTGPRAFCSRIGLKTFLVNWSFGTVLS